MFSNKKLNQITGFMLIALTVGSAALAVGGIWGVIEGEKAFQLFLTFVVTGATTSAVATIADKFYKE